MNRFIEKLSKWFEDDEFKYEEHLFAQLCDKESQERLDRFLKGEIDLAR